MKIVLIILLRDCCFTKSIKKFQFEIDQIIFVFQISENPEKRGSISSMNSKKKIDKPDMTYINAAAL